MATRSALQKQRRHLLTLANGQKHERKYVLKTAPASLDARLHGLAVHALNGNIPIPANLRTTSGMLGLKNFVRAPAHRRISILKGQRGSGFLGTLAKGLAEIAMPLLSTLFA